VYFCSHPALLYATYPVGVWLLLGLKSVCEFHLWAIVIATMTLWWIPRWLMGWLFISQYHRI
jgi:hypothetical protein